VIPAEAVEAAAKALAEEMQSEYLPEAWMHIARAALEAASPGIAREALANELVELAELIEPYSGIGLANGATRSEVAQWIRNRAAEYRSIHGDD
jgi:hypothetical protein